MKIFSNLMRYTFIILLCLDLTIYISTDFIKKPIFDIVMAQKGEAVIFFLETEKGNPRWGNKSDALYISESDEFVNIGVAKAQKSNYFISSIWGNRFIYLPKEDRYQINKAAGDINIAKKDSLANGGLFIARVDVINTEPVYYVGYTQNESPIADKSLIYKEKFHFANGSYGWIFVADELIGQNDSGEIYILI